MQAASCKVTLQDTAGPTTPSVLQGGIAAVIARHASNTNEKSGLFACLQKKSSFLPRPPTHHVLYQISTWEFKDTTDSFSTSPPPPPKHPHPPRAPIILQLQPGPADRPPSRSSRPSSWPSRRRPPRRSAPSAKRLPRRRSRCRRSMRRRGAIPSLRSTTANTPTTPSARRSATAPPRSSPASSMRMSTNRA